MLHSVKWVGERDGEGKGEREGGRGVEREGERGREAEKRWRDKDKKESCSVKTAHWRKV